MQLGECFVGSGNTNDWLRVKLAELLFRSRCSAALLTTDTVGDEDGDEDDSAGVLEMPE